MTRTKKAGNDKKVELSVNGTTSRQATPQAARPSLVGFSTQGQLAGLAVEVEVEEDNGPENGHEEEHLGGKEHDLEPDVLHGTLELDVRHFFFLAFSAFCHVSSFLSFLSLLVFFFLFLNWW